MDTGSTKRALRNQINLQRPHSSLGLLEQLQNLTRQTMATKIASYSPLANEPDLTSFNDWAAANLHLYFPRMIGDQMEFAPGPLKAGNYGILEPVGKAVSPADLDLVFVPALAVDHFGNRLGKGKGIYDRWLGANFHSRIYAVVFDSEVLDLVPHEFHDKKVNGIVTPTGLIAILSG
jgi:5-formyltetrahydrofolate cyclo-ligase